MTKSGVQIQSNVESCCASPLFLCAGEALKVVPDVFLNDRGRRKDAPRFMNFDVI